MIDYEYNNKHDFYTNKMNNKLITTCKEDYTNYREKLRNFLKISGVMGK